MDSSGGSGGSRGWSDDRPRDERGSTTAVVVVSAVPVHPVRTALAVAAGVRRGLAAWGIVTEAPAVETPETPETPEDTPHPDRAVATLRHADGARTLVLASRTPTRPSAARTGGLIVAGLPFAVADGLVPQLPAARRGGGREHARGRITGPACVRHLTWRLTCWAVAVSLVVIALGADWNALGPALVVALGVGLPFAVGLVASLRRAVHASAEDSLAARRVDADVRWAAAHSDRLGLLVRTGASTFTRAGLRAPGTAGLVTRWTTGDAAPAPWVALAGGSFAAALRMGLGGWLAAVASGAFAASLAGCFVEGGLFNSRGARTLGAWALTGAVRPSGVDSAPLGDVAASDFVPSSPASILFAAAGAALLWLALRAVRSIPPMSSARGEADLEGVAGSWPLPAPRRLAALDLAAWVGGRAEWKAERPRARALCADLARSASRLSRSVQVGAVLLLIAAPLPLAPGLFGYAGGSALAGLVVMLLATVGARAAWFWRAGSAGRSLVRAVREGVPWTPRWPVTRLRGAVAIALAGAVGAQACAMALQLHVGREQAALSRGAHFGAMSTAALYYCVAASLGLLAWGLARSGARGVRVAMGLAALLAWGAHSTLRFDGAEPWFTVGMWAPLAVALALSLAVVAACPLPPGPDGPQKPQTPQTPQTPMETPESRRPGHRETAHDAGHTA